jgi:phosphoenolpyruvate carboxylase
MQAYANLVANEEVRTRQYRRIAEEHRRTEEVLNDYFGASRMERRPRLMKTLAMRAAGLRRLHDRQIELLHEWRALRAESRESEAEALFPSLLLSINAIAGAERTTG